jgi:coiled-coil domain-containing protein 174
MTGNPVNFFPVYEPSSDRVAAIQAAAAEENNPLNIHYDANREVRAKGAGFYEFSADEETRKKQMEELRQARHETEMTRQELGAVDLKAGEVEGMQEAPNALRSRAIEKRKRELEERRKLVEAKRRKLLNGNKSLAAAATRLPASAPSSETIVAEPIKTMAAPDPDTASSAADDFLAALERDLAMNKR